MGYTDAIKILNKTLEIWLVDFISYLPNLMVAFFILFLCYIFAKTVRRLATRFFTHHFPEDGSYLSLVNTGVTILFWFIGVFLALNILNLTSLLTHILAGAGIMGIVAGFALNDVSQNAFAGLLIRTQKPFVLGDWVKIQDYFGVVEKIGFVGTSIRTYEGRLAYVPNQIMFSGPFLNFSTFGKVKIIIEMGVSYGDDLDFVEKIAKDAIKDLPMIIDRDTLDFYFVNVGASTYNFVIRFHIKFTEHIDMLKAQSMAIKNLKKAFEKENISVAYNVMTLDFGVKGGVNLFDKAIKVENAKEDKD